ncbi:uncharacterized protein LOC110444898 [Mizuhopecten yessoensis]|uniref:uncharacterized protein LOC110444898 n=1 Tax=Mizuhopecten yessoensis TaxID=6573 RepID=UPI000B45AAC5|nr:uncharacterized protein LOC110444898 [Mizuhopecten yessoensis]
MATPSAPEIVSCPSHPGEEIVFVCSGCGDMFACSLCVTSVHRGHILNGVQETAKSLKEQISELVSTRSADAESVAKRLDDINVDYDQTTDNLRNLIVEVKLRREKVKVMVDEVAEKVLQRIQDLLDDNEANVTDYRTTLHDLEKQLHYLTKDKNESVLLYGDATDIINYYKELALPPNFPRFLPFRRAKFTSTDLAMDDLRPKFGSFAENKIERRESAHDPPPRPPRTKPEIESSVPLVVPRVELNQLRKVQSERRAPKKSAKNNNSEQQSLGVTTSKRHSSTSFDFHHLDSPKNVSPDLKIMANIPEESTFRIRSLSYDKRKFVISYISDRRLIFVNEKGEKTRKVRVMSNIMDVCVSPLTGYAWICCEDHSVTEIEQKTRVIRFKTKSLPLCICAQQSGAFLIGVTNDIIQCNDTGKELLRTKWLGGRLSVVYPRVIRESPCSREIAASYGYEMERPLKVTLFDSELNIKFQFPTDQIPQEDFGPVDICFTPDGQLLILDNAANKLVWVGRQGAVLKETILHQYHPSVMALGPGNQLCLVHQSMTSQILTTDIPQSGRNEYTYCMF